MVFGSPWFMNWCPVLSKEVTSGTFPPVGAVRLGKNRYGTVRVSIAQSGRGPDLAGYSCTYLSVLLRWGTKRSERLPTSSNYTRSVLIGRENHHSRATGG